MSAILNGRLSTDHGTYFATVALRKFERVLLADGPPYVLVCRFWELGGPATEMRLDVDPGVRPVEEVALEMGYAALDRWRSNHSG